MRTEFGPSQTEIDPIAARLLGQLRQSSQKLGSVESLQILQGSFPFVLPDLQQAAATTDKIERFRILSSLAQKLGSSKATNGAEDKALVLSEASNLAGLAAQSVRNPQLFEAFIEELGGLSALEEERRNKLKECDEIISRELDSFFRETDPVAYGTQSVVYQMGFQERPEELKSALAFEGYSDTEKDSAVKVLKLYRKGKVDAELKRHQEAYNLIETGRGKNKGKDAPLMRIPKPHLIKDVPLSENTVSQLQVHHCDLKEKKAEVLMMDFIKGKDFQHIILSKALSLKGEKFNSDIYDSVQLYEKAGDIFGFVKVAPGATPSQQWKARRDNMTKVYSLLARSGVKINPAVLKQLGNGLKVWQDAGFVHGDLHERNLMYEGSEESFFSSDEQAVGQTYAIDFGPLPADEEEFAEPGQDKVVYNRLAELNK